MKDDDPYERRNGWMEHQMFVLSELKHLNRETEDQTRDLKELRSSIDEVRSLVNVCIVEVEKLKVRSAIWGTAAGLIAGGIITVTVRLLVGKF